MILAETLKTLTTFTPPALTRAINLAGYKRDSFIKSKFIGMTNGQQFCYECSFDDGDKVDTCKVFLDYDTASGKVSASY